MEKKWEKMNCIFLFFAPDRQNQKCIGSITRSSFLVFITSMVFPAESKQLLRVPLKVASYFLSSGLVGFPDCFLWLNMLTSAGFVVAGVAGEF